MTMQGRNLLAAVPAAFLIAAFFADCSFAARTTVTVTNETPYPLDVIYKAVGCAKFHSDGVGIYTPEVCHVIENVQPHQTVSYEFGGGTSGRKVWAEIVSATCAGLTCTDSPQMMISTDQASIDNWNGRYIASDGVGHHAMIRDGFAEGQYWLGDNYSNSCAVKGFGIRDDAHVKWTKLEIQGVYVDSHYRNQFVADCGLELQQPGAVYVSLGECETKILNRVIDDPNLPFLQQFVGALADDCSADAKNHGQFVSCISRSLNDLVKDKMITGKEKGAIMACAAQNRGEY